MSIVPAKPHLVGDIGDTNARFALAGPDGRIYAERLAGIPTYVITAEHPALRGAAAAIAD